MTDFLEQVIAERRADVAAAKAEKSERELLDEAKDNRGSRRDLAIGVTPVMRGLGYDAFTAAIRMHPGRLAVIAEVKRVSPARGVLASDADAATLARSYASAGACAISVLTEPRHWGGSLRDLAAVRDAVPLPILCKDVIVDEYQLVQARVAGADAVLLIAEALSDEELRRFIDRSNQLGMGVLVEAHEPVAFGRAVATRAPVVGVNARDLRHPQQIDIGRVRQLHTFVGQHQLLIAESGITSVDDARLLPRRVNGVLVGTALMQAQDPRPLIEGLVGPIRRKAERILG
jgi:indole-3-glycerol phosphate synthase